MRGRQDMEHCEEQLACPALILVHEPPSTLYWLILIQFALFQISLCSADTQSHRSLCTLEMNLPRRFFALKASE